MQFQGTKHKAIYLIKRTIKRIQPTIVYNRRSVWFYLKRDFILKIEAINFGIIYFQPYKNTETSMNMSD
jgi:hypothetical protein